MRLYSITYFIFVNWLELVYDTAYFIAFLFLLLVSAFEGTVKSFLYMIYRLLGHV